MESATAKFAEVQSAHEVLSDPQERAWYDSHRDSILRGDTGGQDDHFERDIHLTSAGDIVGLISRFNRNVPFTDGPNGFYGILREMFTKIGKEEDAACDWGNLEPVEYPDFGSKEDEYEDVVKPFYRTWINFTTKKTFSWRDAYRASDAPDRATRRLVEKENKRLRDEGVREFNDAVRHLVAFVRKRDPRYVPNSQTEEDRQKILRDAAAAQAARSRAENQAKLNSHVVPEWAKSQKLENEGGFSDEELSEVEHIECVVCGKTFKSEKQYETHERSKKHNKAVQQLKREMRLENEVLNLDANSASDAEHLVSDFEDLEVTLDPKADAGASKPPGDATNEASPHARVEGEEGEGEEGEGEELAATDLKTSKKDTEADDSPTASSEDDEYASRKQVESRIAANLGEADTSSAAVSVTSEEPKLGRAKLKRAKKQAKQGVSAQEGQEVST